jgi:hypothetical protein
VKYKYASYTLTIFGIITLSEISYITYLRHSLNYIAKKNSGIITLLIHSNIITLLIKISNITLLIPNNNITLLIKSNIITLLTK